MSSMPPDYNQQTQTPAQPYIQPPVQMQPPPAEYQPPRRGLGKIGLIVIVLLAILFLSVVVFAGWAFSSRNDYKNNVDKKINTAVDKAVKASNAKKDAEFAQREKEPLKVYQGPAEFGTVKIKYPKTWSAFITQDAKNSIPVNAYLHPDFVPGLQSGTAYALRLEIIQGDYDQQLKKFDSLSKAKKVKVTPFQSGSTTGARIDGEIDKGKKGSIVLLPLRDKTIKLTTESEIFVNDFNDIILKNLTFIP